MTTNQELIEHLERSGVLRSPKLKQALEHFPREYFVPKELLGSAYEDYPLPIGEAQTISQPYTIIFMLEELGVKAGDKVLEIGAGSGWQTAILSYLVGKEGRRPSVASAKDGHVWAYEIRHEVAEFGKQNIERFKRDARGASLRNFDYVEGDARAHWREHAPYNRIIAGAAFGDINETRSLKSLLGLGGRMVIPTLNDDIRVVERAGKNKFKEKIHFGFVFVPVVH